MGIDVGLLGSLRGPSSQATIPVTDLSPEHSGGQSVATGPVVDSDDERFILYGGAAVVVASVVLLWLAGGIAFRGLPSI